MRNSHPLISIGMPVYNAEQFLSAALESLLAQTTADFEVLISDNASEDRTEEISRMYAARDHRVRYFRNEANLGASPNFNSVLQMATGRYFKWAAHDDMLHPEYLARCMRVMEESAEIVHCYTKTKLIDYAGMPLRTADVDLRLDSGKLSHRFVDLITLPPWFYAQIVFGLMRTEAAKRTRGMGNYLAADLVFVTELSFHGRIHEVPEYLFYRRIHPLDSWRGSLSLEEDSAWFDTAKPRKRVTPNWTLFLKLLSAIQSSGLSCFKRSHLYLLMAFFFWPSRLLRWVIRCAQDAWSYVTRQALACARYSTLPSRCWFLLRQLRRKRIPFRKALRNALEVDADSLLLDLALTPSGRLRDPKSQLLLQSWLSDSSESTRLRAALTLSRCLEPKQCAQIFYDRAMVEESEKVLEALLQKLSTSRGDLAEDWIRELLERIQGLGYCEMAKDFLLKQGETSFHQN